MDRLVIDSGSSGFVSVRPQFPALFRRLVALECSYTPAMRELDSIISDARAWGQQHRLVYSASGELDATTTIEASLLAERRRLSAWRSYQSGCVITRMRVGTLSWFTEEVPLGVLMNSYGVISAPVKAGEEVSLDLRNDTSADLEYMLTWFADCR